MGVRRGEAGLNGVFFVKKPEKIKNFFKKIFEMQM